MDSSIALERLREHGIEFKVESHRELGVFVCVNKTKNIKTYIERKFNTVPDAVDWLIDTVRKAHPEVFNFHT